MELHLELDRESDGRWIAEVPELPGVLAYGASKGEAARAALVLALRALAEELEHGELHPSTGEGVTLELPFAPA